MIIYIYNFFNLKKYLFSESKYIYSIISYIPGYRQRSRVILRMNQDNGTICPHLQEFQPCEYPPCYTWKTQLSGECKLKYPDMQCGEGLQNRASDCISILGVSSIQITISLKIQF